jgi:hypothetical protein
MYDVSPRKQYVSKNRLDEQIAATGNSIMDIKAVLMGHLRKWSWSRLEHRRAG